MVSRFVVPLLCASALAFAYGPLSSHSRESEPATPHAAVDSSSRDVVASLDVRVGERGERVDVALNVANAADRRVELTFPTGQTHDLVVLDAAGQEVWRWSAGRLFTRAVQTKLLSAGETVSYGERWTPGERRGTYTLVATLHSGNYPVELRQGITLP